MDEVPKKGTTLSIDRAAFLLLRVKKAFKKKRQQRKDRQAAAQNAIDNLSGFSGNRSIRGRGGPPPPLLRSRTLPAIIVPGISILQAQIDPPKAVTGESPRTQFHSTLTPRILLSSDDSPLDYRRKSAGHAATQYAVQNPAHDEPYIYAFDEVERHADGTVILRIPAPHIIAARAYRISSASGPSGTAAYQASAFATGMTTSATGGTSSGSGSGSGNQGSTALYRLARLLNQTSKSASNNITSPTQKEDTPRRLSWERRDQGNSRLPRSSSIDSMVEAVWSDSPRLSLAVPQYSQNTQLVPPTNSGSNSRRESLSPSASRRSKQNRGITEITLPEYVVRDTNKSPIGKRDSAVPLHANESPNGKLNRLSFNMDFLISHPPRTTTLGTTVTGQDTITAQKHQQHPQQQQLVQNSGLFLTNNSIKIINNLNIISSSNNNNHQRFHKMTKKESKLAQAQLDKMTQINIHLHALFAAVEHGHLEKARTILESTDVDVNSSNSDGLAPLDVAVLSNNRSMTKMLLQHGAAEGSNFKSPDTLGNHLNALLCDAEHRIHELGGVEESPHPFNTRASFSSIIGTSGPSVTGCAGGDVDKQLGLWDRRVKGIRRMILGWDQARPPDMPMAVTIDVVGLTTVSIRIHESNEGSICTKFKVQWSSRVDFSNIVGERELLEWSSFHGTMGANCRLSELTQGRRYFFRACCGNVKGWGQYKLSSPSSVIPSSWRDVDKREPRFAGRQRILDDLFTAVRLARPDDASDIPLETPALQRRNPKKKTTIKQLFSAASKFQKNLRRGIYLACILYHEDKILVTNEDFLPVIEIDETYPSYLHTDHHWLMKVACTWDDVKSLRTDMERNPTSAIHFRTKLLSAACQMQSALCITDLGQLFHKPLKDSQGTVVLSTVNCVKSPKTVSVLNSRWIPLNKVYKKLNVLHEENTINEILLNSIQEQITYHQVSTVKLSPGLYLGYLKMQSSVDLIQVVVPTKTPNVLPHCKIRDNPHISAEEWKLLKRNKSLTSLEFRQDNIGPTEVQLYFLESLTSSAHRLFKSMDIAHEEALTHRLYDIEVIELNSEVSFLIICPPAESSCAVPGQREILLQRGDLLSMPIQAFEMIHLRTYQISIIQKYSRLSCILELDTVLANHSHREAFSTIEVQTAKERLAKLQELSGNLNIIWKGVRWLMDVIAFARDRGNIPGLSMREILEYKEDQENKDGEVNARQLLQPPRDTKLVKSSPGRGSWPGPVVSNVLGPNNLLCTEHSKSEQQLLLSGSHFSSRYLSATSGLENTSRKNSADSNYSHSGNSYYSAGEPRDFVIPRLPPSRSEDALNMERRKSSSGGNSHRKRSTTINSSFSATSSPLMSAKSTVTEKTTTESMNSLSSDSESVNLPINSSTPNQTFNQNMKTTKTTAEIIEIESNMGSSVSCKKQLFEDKTKPIGSYFKPTMALAELQNEARTYQESLFIAEEDSLTEPFHEAPGHKAISGIRSDNHHQSSTAAASTSNFPEHNPQSSDRRTVPFYQIKSSPEKTTSKSIQSSDKEMATVDNSSSNSSTSPAGSSNSLASSCKASILQVYAAYETGLASGTSLKLRVTPRTSAREVIDLVIKQLNMAVVLKGKEGPIYTSDKLENFCLVAVIGARERCLRDDFKPLQLQNPWKKGRLYVRQKHDLLAAIEHSNRDADVL